MRWHSLMPFPRYRESEDIRAVVLTYVVGDRGYDGIDPARSAWPTHHPFSGIRNTEHGGALGRWRWVVERTFACLNEFQRLRVRYKKGADIREAFLSLGCALICWYFLRVDWVTS
jgi:transposase